MKTNLDNLGEKKRKRPMATLYKELIKYSQSDYYPFHMPGGKRNPQLTKTGLPYHLDITEIEGFDDLHHGVGLIKELEERASKVYNSSETALLVNGSTSGLLAGIMACTNKGDKILVGRNSHKSIYHGIFLNELEAVYLYPEYNHELDCPLGINPKEVWKVLEENPDIKAVVITSPTFEGVVSEVEEIARMTGQKKIPLIVDEAHGAHFGFNDGFPANSNTLGGDLVIHSIHKTLPSFTQTALIHKNGNLVDWDKVKFYLQIFQSSSPSYILMSSVDVCISMLENTEKRDEYFSKYERRLNRAREKIKECSNLKLVETKNFDPSKILVSGKKINKTGLELYHVLLEKYRLQMEMATGFTVLAMTSIADTEEGLERLVYALEEMDKAEVIGERRIRKEGDGTKTLLEKERKVLGQELGIKTKKDSSWEFPKLEQVYKISHSPWGKKEPEKVLPFKGCENYISKEFVYLYPPGSPLIVPGERICKRAVEILLQYERLGYKIKGTRQNGKIEVLENKGAGWLEK